jgi:hypothetical protein
MGLAVAASGVLLTSVCTFNIGCSEKTKRALAIVGGIMGIVSLIIIGAGVGGAIVAAVTDAATTATIATGQMAAGFELTQAAMANGVAMTAAQAEAIANTLAALAGPVAPSAGQVLVTLGEGVDIGIAILAPRP